MKRSERHHLKENAVARALQTARDALAGHERTIVSVLVAIILIAAAVAGFLAWQQRSQDRAEASLAQALTLLQAPVVPLPAPGEETDTPPAQPPGTYPSEAARLDAALPALLEVAATFPDTRAGIAARYHAGAALAGLGRYGEAEARYREVIEQAGSSLHGYLARLGLADTLARQGQYDAAIALYEEVAGRAADMLPLDAVLMELARAYRLAGRQVDALQTYTRIIDEFPASLYLVEARRQIDELRDPEEALITGVGQETA